MAKKVTVTLVDNYDGASTADENVCIAHMPGPARSRRPGAADPLGDRVEISSAREGFAFGVQLPSDGDLCANQISAVQVDYQWREVAIAIAES
ncbi:hypothetical protein [Nocardia sp. NPDC004711]